ncbi:hypothetical protein cypCar_00042688 [Cyprinus carpio]|nr:hypothetical protein cypCar_00042688 [Cyprinus carpio]
MASERTLSVEQCSAVLQSAENDVLTNILNLMGDWRYVREMTREQELMLVYFLEALMMLSFLQEPEVVKKMTVSDWLKRTYIEGNRERVLVGVDECNAFFVLSNEEEAWFDVYYQSLRSVLITRRHRRCSADEAEKFFLCSSGNPVDNPCEDLKKLHDEYDLPSITTDMLRSSVHTAVHKLHLTDDEKLSSPAQAPEAKWMNANTAFYLLKMSHPPSESKVHSWIEKQGWMENVPDAAEVVKDWKPPRSIQAPTDSKSIRRMSRRQCWKGLQLMDREGKGLRVVTSRPFACGEVICDFHGRLISRDEGLEIQQSNQTQAGHLFFFTSKNGQDMCLDAHEERCECHPNKTTFGRQMKHSVTRANLSPRLHFVEDEPLILFMATRDIQTGEELRYDYGDNRRSYAGDGLDLTPS